MKLRIPVASIALTSVLFGLPVSSLATVTIAVVDHDTGVGIIADVFKVTSDTPPKRLPIGTTDATGVTTNPLATCVFGDTIATRPVSADYAPPASESACSGQRITIKLRSLARNKQIQAIAAKSEQTGNFGLAAQALNELNATKPDDQIADRLYSNTAQALGLPANSATVTDPQQGKSVPSAKLVSTVKDFQRKNGLEANGIIGTDTLRALAGGSVSHNLLKAETN